ncbi:hypothetical protein OSTOST_14576 [Ostertagia ostertagi]
MAIAFVSVGAITSHWSVLVESGTYIAILSCSPQDGESEGIVCHFSWKGRSIYPGEPVPYKEICLDRTMQAVLLTTFGGNTAFFIFLHYGPTFINKALGFDISETGFATALPYALCVVLKFLAGPLFDHSTFISEKYRMIMFASLSQGVMVICFLVLSQVARQHVHFVMVGVTLGGCAICFILPVVVALLCPNNTLDEWSRLFLGVGFFVLLCNVPFLFLASSEPAPWTKSAAFREASGKNLMAQSMGSMEKCDTRIHPESPLPW